MFLEEQNPACTRCGPPSRRYAVISTPLPLSQIVMPFEASRQGMVQPYMRTLPLQDVDLGGMALSPSLPLYLMPFEASHQEMDQSEIRTQPAQYVNPERERVPSHQGTVQPTLPVQDVDLGGVALSPSLPLCLTPFEASHQEMFQLEIRTQPAQYVDPERERFQAEILQLNTQHFHVLIIGRANAGKTTILQQVCNTTEQPKIFNPQGHQVCVIHIILCH